MAEHQRVMQPVLIPRVEEPLERLIVRSFDVSKVGALPIAIYTRSQRQPGTITQEPIHATGVSLIWQIVRSKITSSVLK